MAEPSESPVENSPLKEAAPQSLSILFNADPLSLSDKDLDIIVAELRRQRESWLKAEAAGVKKGKAAIVAKSIDDLGL